MKRAATGEVQGGPARPVRLPPIGFWSYSRQDDELSHGSLSLLRSLLMAEMQQQYGREQIQLFQDTSTIAHGAAWELEIRTSLGASTFFIPIITPNFIQSEWCSIEVRIFLERERELFETYQDLPRRSRVFPILLIDIGRIEAFDEDVLAALKRLQWFDFRGFRHKDFRDEAVRRALSEFAGSISELLHAKVQPPIKEAERARFAAEADQARLREEEQKAAERERLRQLGAEAERARVEEEGRRQAEQAAAAAEARAEAQRPAEKRRRGEAVERARREEEQQQAALEERLHQEQQKAEQVTRRQRAMEALAAKEAARLQRKERMRNALSQLSERMRHPLKTTRGRWVLLGLAVAILAAWIALDRRSTALAPAPGPIVKQNAPERRQAPPDAPAPPAHSWLFGRWGVDGDCRIARVVTGAPAGIHVAFRGGSQDEAVQEATSERIVTNIATYRRDGMNIRVREPALDLEYRFTPCP
jgi:hypothetical protein